MGQIPAPAEAFDETWRLVSLLPSSGLANRRLFNIDFESSGGGRVGRVWIAASDGLYSYDGYNWRRFGKAHGLPSDFVRSVLVARDGQVWVGTDHGAGAFDGKVFRTHGSEHHLAGPNVRRIVEDPDGTLWFCSDSWPNATARGGVTRLRGSQWRIWRREDGLPSEYVVNYFRSSDGKQFVVTLEGIAQLQGERWVAPEGTWNAEGQWSSGSLAESPTFGILASTGKDVFVLKNSTWKRFPDAARHEHGITATRDGRIVAGVDAGNGRRTFSEWSGTGWRRLSAEFPVSHGYVEQVREAPDGSLWVLGFDCLYRWEWRSSEWRQFPGAPIPRLSDAQGRVWLMNTEAFFRSNGERWDVMGQPLQRLVLARDGNVWAWGNGVLVRWRGEERSSYGETETGLSAHLNVSVAADGKPWVFGKDRLGRRQLVVFDGLLWQLKTIPELADSRRVWSAADPASGMWYLVERENAAGFLLVHLTERAEIYPVPADVVSQFNNNLKVDRTGDVWLTGDAGAHRWRRKQSRKWEKLPNTPGRSVVAWVERNHDLWFAMNGSTGGRDGLARLSNGAWKTYDSDLISSWTLSSDGTLVFGSQGKLYIIPDSSESEPLEVRLPYSDRVLGIVKNAGGTYWIGTSRGVTLFHPGQLPPETRIASAGDRTLHGAVYMIRVEAQKRFHPPGDGLNFRFSTRLNQGPWSSFGSSSEVRVATAGLGTGRHRIEVRAQDNGMGVDPTPAAADFQVHALPLQERSWFLPLTAGMAVLMAGLTTFALSARRRLARQARSLEEIVANRTSELRTSEERHRQIVETALEGIWIIDEEDRVSFVNQQLASMLAYAPDEMRGMPVREFVPDDLQRELEQKLARCREGIRESYDFSFRRRDGSVLHAIMATSSLFDKERRYLGALAMLTDITERAKAELLLKKSEMSLANAQQMAHMGNWEASLAHSSSHSGSHSLIREGPVTWSEEMYRIFGVDPATFTPDRESFFAAVHPDDRESLRAAADKAVATGTAYGIEYRIIRPDGMQRHVREHAAVTTDANGKPIALTGTVQDITVHKSLEEQLHQSQRLESIGQLAGGIAHDFNNILTVINGYTDLVLHEMPASDPARDSLEQVRAAGDQAAALTNQLLVFSRKQMIQPTVLNLNDIVADLHRMLKRLIGEHISIVTKLSPTLGNITADPGQIQQVIMNLAVNARDAMPYGGKLLIETTNVTIDESYVKEHAEVQPGAYVLLALSDTGIGMSPEVKARLFEPFFTTKERGKGTGLGLATVYAVVKQSGGWIWVYSEPGKGTAFKIYIPRTDAPVPPTYPIVKADLRGSETVLVAEDQLEVRTLISTALSGYGYTVLSTPSGEEALSTAKDFSEPIDLLLTDVVMPGMTGPDLARRFLSTRPHARVLYMSGYTEDAMGQYRILDADVAYLQKPFTAETLAAKVRAVLGAG